MTVSAAPSFNIHTGNGVTLVFSYGFRILASSHLKVYFDGVLQAAGYTVGGVGATGGGTVTFTTAPASGVAVLLKRSVPRTRTVDYVDNGDFTAEDIDNDQDLQTMSIQDIGTDADRAIKLPIGDSNPELPAASERADKILSFDAAGVPTVVALASDSSAALRIDLASTAVSKGSALVAGTRKSARVSDFSGADPTGTVDSTAALLAAIATGRLVYLDGFYRISTSLSTLLAGMVGDGAQKSGLICDGVHGITLPSNLGLSRRAMRLEGFAIDALGANCDDKFAIYAPGVAVAAAAVYNSGLDVAGLSIGQSSRMGGFMYLKDFFRVNVQDVGCTDVNQMIRLVGSVVQAKFRNVTSNNDAAALTGGATLITTKKGIVTAAATYASGTLTPENIRAIDCSYIRGDRGIDHAAGLDVEFENFDAEADTYGALLNAPCTMRGGILVPGTGATAWTGVLRGVSLSDPDDGTVLDGVDVNALRAPGTPGSSYGFDFGDGVSPVYGAVMRNCRVRGLANSLQSAVRGRDLRDFTMEDNFVRTSAIISDDVSLIGRRLFVNRNRIVGGTLVISDGGEATAYGDIKNNQVATLTTTLTTNDNWTLENNETASEGRGFGQANSTYTGTLTGCTTAPTGTVRAAKLGRAVTLLFPSITATSNAATATITGMPATLRPNRDQYVWGVITNNGNTGIGAFLIRTTGVIEMYVGTNFAAFDAAGTKGVQSCSVSYDLS